MARPVYTVQIMSGEFIGVGSLDFTIPDGFVGVIRDILWDASGGADAAATIALGVEGVFPLQWFIPADWSGSEHVECRIAIPGGVTMSFGSSGSSELTIQFVITGYLLSA